MINKKDLISLIQQTDGFLNPKIELEQYCIDAQSAVDIVYFAGVEFNDIKNHLVIDLGAGTGRLSIACAYLRASYILSVDIDMNALRILKTNINDLGLETIILPICSDINHFEIVRQLLPKELNITTIENPPFGVQKKTADRYFLQKAFSFSDIVYSIHLANQKVHQFITSFIRKFKWEIDYVFPFKLKLDRTYEFHIQKTKSVDVNIYRFKRKEDRK
ncbi:MAG: methyltransferase [Candidatus Lokiarchaeota archaeon]|nr:methyltransferase [Candidatus Lokiarchaeota archaeon]